MNATKLELAGGSSKYATQLSASSSLPSHESIKGASVGCVVGIRTRTASSRTISLVASTQYRGQSIQPRTLLSFQLLVGSATRSHLHRCSLLSMASDNVRQIRHRSFTVSRHCRHSWTAIESSARSTDELMINIGICAFPRHGRRRSPLARVNLSANPRSALPTLAITERHVRWVSPPRSSQRESSSSSMPAGRRSCS